VSIGPILSVPASASPADRRPRAAVSPIVGGKTIRAPPTACCATRAAASATTVGKLYKTSRPLVIDNADARRIEALG
jgi:2-phospho-L-lactate transferase/gluconeogenesis factor (CofD/UPF0052 family)